MTRALLQRRHPMNPTRLLAALSIALLATLNLSVPQHVRSAPVTVAGDSWS